MSRCRITPRARKDLHAISRHISKDSPAAAKRTITELQSVCKTMLAAFPRAGTQRDDLLPGMRCFSVGNYVIFFRGENPVEILRILHGAMDFDQLRFDADS